MADLNLLLEYLSYFQVKCKLDQLWRQGSRRHVCGESFFNGGQRLSRSVFLNRLAMELFWWAAIELFYFRLSFLIYTEYK